MGEPGYIVASDSENTGGGGGDERPPSGFPETAIGIDIGTSQCSVAVWNGSKSELIKNTRDQKMMRSYVTFKGNGGDAAPSGGATSQLEMLSGTAIFNMKRLVGRVDTDPVVVQSARSLPFLVQPHGIGARPFVAALVNNVWRSTTPEEVLAIFLVEIRAMAESRLSRRVGSAVLTIPVSFSRFQLTCVERACAMAGLRVLRLMAEPTAVAMLYSQQQRESSRADDGSEKIVLIFNMGAGYTDVAVSATASGVSQIRAVAGAVIGGEDLLQNTMRCLLPEADSLFAGHRVDDTMAMGILRVATQDAIHLLSTQTSAMIDVDLGNGTKICKVLERYEFEEVNKDVFDQCGSLITQCLNDSKCEVTDLNDVILVGGCSHIPRVKALASSICQRTEFHDRINPLEAAVSGAAIEAAVASGVSDPFGLLDLLTIQVTPHTIGIRADGGKFVPVVQRNTVIPTRKELIFSTAHDGQTEALIVVEEGEASDVIGYFKIIGIPAAPRGTPEIGVCMDVDVSNVLRVFTGVAQVKSGSSAASTVPFVEVRMPMVDGGYDWCAEALSRVYGSSLDLVSVKLKI